MAIDPIKPKVNQPVSAVQPVKKKPVEGSAAEATKPKATGGATGVNGTKPVNQTSPQKDTQPAAGETKAVSKPDTTKSAKELDASTKVAGTAAKAEFEAAQKLKQAEETKKAEDQKKAEAAKDAIKPGQTTNAGKIGDQKPLAGKATDATKTPGAKDPAKDGKPFLDPAGKAGIKLSPEAEKQNKAVNDAIQMATEKDAKGEAGTKKMGGTTVRAPKMSDDAKPDNVAVAENRSSSQTNPDKPKANPNEQTMGQLQQRVASLEAELGISAEEKVDSAQKADMGALQQRVALLESRLADKNNTEQAEKKAAEQKELGKKAAPETKANAESDKKSGQTERDRQQTPTEAKVVETKNSESRNAPGQSTPDKKPVEGKNDNKQESKAQPPVAGIDKTKTENRQNQTSQTNQVAANKTDTPNKQKSPGDAGDSGNSGNNKAGEAANAAKATPAAAKSNNNGAGNSGNNGGGNNAANNGGGMKTTAAAKTPAASTNTQAAVAPTAPAEGGMGNVMDLLNQILAMISGGGLGTSGLDSLALGGLSGTTMGGSQTGLSSNPFLSAGLMGTGGFNGAALSGMGIANANLQQVGLSSSYLQNLGGLASLQGGQGVLGSTGDLLSAVGRNVGSIV